MMTLLDSLKIQSPVRHRVFFSFHYTPDDTWKVQQIRNIGAIDGSEPVSPNAWEEVKRKGDTAIKSWIHEQMLPRSCVVVFIGEHTAKRKYVKYEITHGWNIGKALLGIYIHNIRNAKGYAAFIQGENPFSRFCLQETQKGLDGIVQARTPNPNDAYNDIARNLSRWIDEAIEIRKKYKDLHCVSTSAHTIYGLSMDRMDS
jgi:hypothetical protein